jgi:hypothetical protein
MDRDKRLGFEFEEYLVEKSPLRRFGYRRNPNKFKIDLVSTGLPSVEVKRECCQHSKRSNGKLVNLCVQLFTKKWRGEPEMNGPWKAVKHGGNSALYIVGEARDGKWRIVFAGLALELARFCESYLPGGPDYHKAFKTDASQKESVLVPLEDLKGINHGFPWVLNFINDRKFW